MKMTLKKASIALIFAILFTAMSCSTRKDKFINRNWHAMTTKYNVLYNGQLAFEEGRAEVGSAFYDDFWEVLPIERLTVSGLVKLDSEDNNPKFERAEEKATKAIQKHSMDIDDIERNPQTDEAFLLLGKARYFDERYIPALESFNYILRKYRQSDKINEARIWRAKVNMRLDNPEIAMKNLRLMIRLQDLSDQEYADAHAVLADCYLLLKQKDSAVNKLKMAQAITPKMWNAADIDLSSVSCTTN